MVVGEPDGGVLVVEAHAGVEDGLLRGGGRDLPHLGGGGAGKREQQDGQHA